MKKRVLKILLVLLLVSVFTVGCSSDDDGATGSFIRARIGMDFWESSTINFSNLIQVSGEGQRYDVQALNDDFQITLGIVDRNVGDCMSTGNYTGDNVLLFYHYNIGNDTFVLEHFPTPLGDSSVESNLEVTVTSCGNGQISGTFSGTLYKTYYDETLGENVAESVHISEGEFQNISYEFIGL